MLTILIRGTWHSGQSSRGYCILRVPAAVELELILACGRVAPLRRRLGLLRHCRVVVAAAEERDREHARERGVETAMFTAPFT